MSEYDQYCRLLFEQFPISLITDDEGRYLFVNDGWLQYMGFKRKEVLGKKVIDIVPESKVDEVLRTRMPINGYPITDKDGNTLFNHCIPLLNGDRLMGAAVLTFFSTMEDAMDFSKAIMKLTQQISYYQEELRRLRGARHTIDEIVGSSQMIQDLKRHISDAARTMSTVLIQGETGSGKELVASAIHDLSPRREKPFVKINCSAIPNDLVESELFGYEGGSFTGANKNGKIGLFEAASSGSLFLDEINQMAYFVQPKLLRVLQEKEILRIGGHKAIPVDTRIITATNKSLEQMVEENQFREDLFYRLNVVNIHIPPLRDHAEDIPELLEHLRIKLNRELGTHVEGITRDAETRLMQYDWPGNVRELGNVLERAINSQMNGVLDWHCFEEYFTSKKSAPVKAADNLIYNRNRLEKELIEECLKKNKYNKTKTAIELGISRTLLYQKLAKYQL